MVMAKLGKKQWYIYHIVVLFDEFFLKIYYHNVPYALPSKIEKT